MRLLTDDDMRRLVTPALVRAAMRDAVLAEHRGELVAPPRAQADLGDRLLRFTCGARPGDWFGYRSYAAPGDAGDDQVVVVHDEATGAVRGLAVGRALGPLRTGGIGAVALDALGPDHPERVAVVGDRLPRAGGGLRPAERAGRIARRAGPRPSGGRPDR